MKDNRINVLNDNSELNSEIDSKIKKINFTYEDLINYEENIGNVEPIGNIKYYKDFYCIKHSQMSNEFGDANFIDDYKEASWWILEYNNIRFAVYTHSIEGSECYIFIDDAKDLTSDVEDFHNKLMSLINFS